MEFFSRQLDPEVFSVPCIHFSRYAHLSHPALIMATPKVPLYYPSGLFRSSSRSCIRKGRFATHSHSPTHPHLDRIDQPTSGLFSRPPIGSNQGLSPSILRGEHWSHGVANLDVSNHQRLISFHIIASLPGPVSFRRAGRPCIIGLVPLSRRSQASAPVYFYTNYPGTP